MDTQVSAFGGRHDASLHPDEAAPLPGLDGQLCGVDIQKVTIPRQSRGHSRCEPLKAAEGDADASPVCRAAYRQPFSVTDSIDPVADLPSPGSFLQNGLSEVDYSWAGRGEPGCVRSGGGGPVVDDAN